MSRRFDTEFSVKDYLIRKEIAECNNGKMSKMANSRNHRLYFTAKDDTGTYEDVETFIDFRKTPIFGVQFKDSKFRFAFDKKGRLMIDTRCFSKFDIGVDEFGNPAIFLTSK